MSNETQTPALPKMTPYDIARNGITKTLSVFTGKRGAWENVQYQAPQIASDSVDGNVEEDATLVGGLNWIGKKNLVTFINTILKRIGQDTWKDAIPPVGAPNAGIFNPDKFINDLTNLAASVLRLAELREKYFEEVAAQQDFIGSDEFQSALMGTDATVKQAAIDKVNSWKVAINGLKAEMEARSARNSKEEATETVQPE